MLFQPQDQKIIRSLQVAFLYNGFANALGHFKTIKHKVKHIVKNISGNF